MEFPRLVKVRQKFPEAALADVAAAVRRELARVGLGAVMDGARRVAITGGSRGIRDLPVILKVLVEELKRAGASPFLVPAMGSHGGATAEGQVKVLASLGVTEATVGAPVVSSMEVVEIGRTPNGAPVYFDRNAAAADAVVVVNRIKPHTGFQGPIQSGLMKMIAVGLGKHRGCVAMHQFGLAETVVAAARVALEKSPIRLGIAVVENAYDRTWKVEAIPAPEIESREMVLLQEARALMPRLPFDEVDLLVVEEMGKEISGTGIDVNIIGRMMKLGQPEFDRPRIKRIVVLDLTEASHGNALGMGLADVVTRRFIDKVDYAATFENVISAGVLERGRTPVWVQNDRRAIEVALQSLGNLAPGQVRMMRIKNTLEIGELYISEALHAEARAQGRGDLVPLGDLEELRFDAEGNLR